MYTELLCGSRRFTYVVNIVNCIPIPIAQLIRMDPALEIIISRKLIPNKIPMIIGIGIAICTKLHVSSNDLIRESVKFYDLAYGVHHIAPSCRNVGFIHSIQTILTNLV